MADSPILPGQHSWRDARGQPLPVEFFKFLRDLVGYVRESGNNSEAIAAMQAQIDALESGGTDANLQGPQSVAVSGNLANGLVQLRLVGDEASPAADRYYGTGTAGEKGYFAVTDAIPGGSVGQFWRGDKSFTNTLEGPILGLHGSDATEVSLDIRNDGGGTTVLHYGFKNPGFGGFPSSGQLLGGAGARPWAGSGYSAHSTAAYHMLATETHTASVSGSDFGILATPIGSDWTGRIMVARFNGDGDVINSRGLLARKINSADRGRGIEVARESGVSAEVSLVSTAGGFGTGYRAYSISGTLASPGGTTVGGGTFFGLCGHDTSAIVGAKALIGMTAQAAWSPTSTPAEIVFETTASGSTSRTRRWVMNEAGHFLPNADNTYNVGSGPFRVGTYYGATGAINTSDAREKTDVVPMSDAEIRAASVIAKLIGTYQWLASVKEKGGDARHHVGLTVQSAIQAMEAEGLDPFRYGFICYDEWSEQPEVRGEDGVVVSPAREAGNRYSFRMDELNLFIARGFEARLAALEQRAA